MNGLIIIALAVTLSILASGTFKNLKSRNKAQAVMENQKEEILNYNHNGKVIARTSNNTLRIETDDEGISIVAVLRNEDSNGKPGV